MPRLSGFTLIEMLIAAAILVLVFTIAGTVLFSVQQTWMKSQQRSDRLKRLITVDRVVNSSFPNIIPFEWRDEQLRTRNIFLGRADHVIFATTHRVNIPQEGALRFIKLYLDGENLVASYRNTPILFWNESVNTTNDEIIASDVQSISFMYADFDANRTLIWENNWDEETRRNIPVAIQMKISWKDDTTTSWMRRTAGAAKREHFGRRINDRARQ